MKIIGIIQARDNSSRLPNKATLPINGKLLIAHVWSRLYSVGQLDFVVVSTSKESPRIIKWCQENEIQYHVGSESDLLSRHIGAAEAFDADAVLRVTADCLFHDPAMLELMITGFLKAKPEALINWHNGYRTVSEGLDAAIVTTMAMRTLSQSKECPREDWLTHMDKHYRVMGWAYPERIGHDLHLSIDTQEDLDMAEKMLKIIGNDNWSYKATLEAYRQVTEKGDTR